jgi:hypothetical protein
MTGGPELIVARFLPWHTRPMLVSPHLSIAGARKGTSVTKPDPSLLDDVVASKVIDAMRSASLALTKLGIRHVVVGGLAVGANGHPRATKDVDFLVGDEAFEHQPGGFVTMKPGVPIQINHVAIDLLSVQPGEEHLVTAFDKPMGSMIEAPQLVYLKLKSPRQKDRVDVIELIKAGIEIDACRTYLIKHAPALTPLFEDSVLKAAAEE